MAIRKCILRRQRFPLISSPVFQSCDIKCLTTGLKDYLRKSSM
uniref:Uncharacterized protein n=1 Tax=Anguilla anguilla TaxID=7936 RepID=A0A0E9WA47_ANGAN